MTREHFFSLFLGALLLGNIWLINARIALISHVQVFTTRKVFISRLFRVNFAHNCTHFFKMKWNIEMNNSQVKLIRKHSNSFKRKQKKIAWISVFNSHPVQPYIIYIIFKNIPFFNWAFIIFLLLFINLSYLWRKKILGSNNGECTT